MNRLATIGILTFVLLVFITTDHINSPAPDHFELEKWRVSGAIGACAPCGALCTDDT